MGIKLNLQSVKGILFKNADGSCENIDYFEHRWIRNRTFLFKVEFKSSLLVENYHRDKLLRKLNCNVVYIVFLIISNFMRNMNFHC